MSNINIDEIVAELTKKLQKKGEQVKLPSGETLNIVPMDYEKEKALFSNPDETTIITNEILKLCIVEDIDIGNLFLFDKTFLLMKIKQISEGNLVEKSVTCPHCRAESNLKIELDQVPVKFSESIMEESIKITLPISEIEVEIKYPKVKDSALLRDAKEVIKNLHKFVRSVGGKTITEVVVKTLAKLPPKDIAEIINHIQPDYGIETIMPIRCGGCGKMFVTEVPVSFDFFTVG